jgi:hypothetical protein
VEVVLQAWEVVPDGHLVAMVLEAELRLKPRGLVPDLVLDGCVQAGDVGLGHKSTDVAHVCAAVGCGGMAGSVMLP